MSRHWKMASTRDDTFGYMRNSVNRKWRVKDICRRCRSAGAESRNRSSKPSRNIALREWKTSVVLTAEAAESVKQGNEADHGNGEERRDQEFGVKRDLHKKQAGSGAKLA